MSAIRTIYPETLDEELLGRLNFPERYPALCALHFPDDTDALQKARRRFAFEEQYEFKLRTAELGKKARAGKRFACIIRYARVSPRVCRSR